MTISKSRRLSRLSAHIRMQVLFVFETTYVGHFWTSSPIFISTRFQHFDNQLVQIGLFPFVHLW